jgi:hypothetical protein
VRLEALCRATSAPIKLDRQRRHILRWTMPGPDSSYSCFEHQRFWKVESEARMEPPIQTEYLRSGGATILTYFQSVSGLFSGMRTAAMYLHARGRKGCELLLHTVSNTREHGGTTGEDDVAVEITTDIKIALIDRVVAGWNASILGFLCR